MILKHVFLLQFSFFVANGAYYEDLVDRFSKNYGNFMTGHNEYFRGMSYERIKRMMGARIRPTSEAPIKKSILVDSARIPERFNSADQWPKCAATISHIKDQSDCGSCWAVAASEVIADRTCVANYASVVNTQPGPLVDMSAEQIMSCCNWCGYGCQGGYTIDAMKYWCWNGVVTGGWYGSNCGCQPYKIPPCTTQDGCKWPANTTPACSRSCRAGYAKTFANDLHFCTNHYLISSTVEQLQAEIMVHGPIECVYTVFENFMTYKGGVYDRTAGRKLGGHAVKVIGWGETNGTPYWIINNSWNVTWGMKGVFWMLRGYNFCGIESYCVAGKAKTGDTDFSLKC